jgi:PAS domain S-box-containing protein
MKPEPFRQFCEVLPEPTLLLEADTRIAAANPAAAELLCCRPSALLGKNFSDLTCDPVKLQKLMRMWERNRNLLPGSLNLRLADLSILDCRVQGGLLAPATEDTSALILLRLLDKNTATTAFRALNDRMEQLSAEVIESRRGEAILHAHKEWLRATLASISDGVLAAGCDGRISFMNRVAEQLTGWRDADARGQPVQTVFRIVNETTRSAVANPLDAVLAEGKATAATSDSLLISRDGSERPIADSAAPILDAAGAVAGAVLIFRDITEQRRATEALRKSEERLRVALQNAPLILSTTDRELRYTWIHSLHPAFSDNVLGKRDDEIVPRDNIHELIELKQRVLDSGNGERREITLKVGAEAEAYDITVEPLLGTDGSLIGLTVAALDITERARAQAAIQRSEREFHQLADSMPQIVWSARPDGHIDYCNERSYELTGLKRKSGRDPSWEPVLHPDDLKRWNETWRETVRSGHPLEIEYRFWDRGRGRYCWFLGRALPIRDDSGQVIRWFGTCTDIDYQKKLVDDLRRMNEDLSQFAYSASHDLKEPLRMIAVYTQLLSRKFSSSLDDTATEYVGYTIQGAHRMEALINDLLRYTAAAEVDTLKAAAVDSNLALQTALSNLRLSIEESGAEIQAAPLPIVRAHQIHVVQIFQNLIGNAIKYRSPAPPCIHIRADRKGTEWVFSVADNGIGIALRYHAHVFGVFKRLHSPSHSSGTGIGLAICKKIVERYEGRIWVESEEGKGSTFFFTLPDAVTDGNPPAVPDERREGSGVPSH